ncbi:MAG: DUF1491 family protein [Alphaproteobacteria bacterium]|nr:DUF1491 family protein [Alphaproteobacteria bacterium]
MTSANLKTGIWVSAKQRQMNGDGPVLIALRKGDADAGTLILRVETPEGERLFSQGRTLDGEPCWYAVLDGRAVPPFEAAEYCEKRVRTDPDLWVLSLDLAAKADPEGPLLDLPVEAV